MPTLWYARGYGARGAAARPSRLAREAGARDRVRRAAPDRRGGRREHARGLRGRDDRRVHPDLGIAGRLRPGGGDRRVPRRPGSAAPPRLDHPGGRADAVRPGQRRMDHLVRQPGVAADPVDRRRALARALPRQLPRARAAGAQGKRAVPAGVWLDGIVAGLGIGAVGAAIVFRPVLARRPPAAPRAVATEPRLSRSATCSSPRSSWRCSRCAAGGWTATGPCSARASSCSTSPTRSTC